MEIVYFLSVLHSDAVSTLATVHILHNLRTEHQLVLRVVLLYAAKY